MSPNPPTEGYGPSNARLFKQFNGNAEEYEIWEETFHAALRILKLHLPFDKYRDVRPAGYVDTLDKQTIYDYLTLCVDKNSLSMIRRSAKDNGVEALRILRQHYMRETSQRTHLHLQSLFTLKMDDSVSEYLLKIENLVATLSANAEEISDRIQVTIVLNGLSPEYSSFREIALQRHPPYNYNQLKIALLNQEDLKKNEEEVGVMKARTSYRRPWSKPNKYRPTKHCKIHGPCGHTDDECFNQKQKEESSDEAKMMKLNTCESDDEHHFSFSVQCSSAKSSSDENLILVDSGCTSHIQNSEKVFNQFHSKFNSNSHRIILADGSQKREAVKGVGSVTERLVDSSGEMQNLDLENVLFIPDFPENILSVYKCVSNGDTVMFSPEGCKLITKEGKDFKIIEKNKMYYLEKPSVENEKFKICKNKPEIRTCAEHTLQDWHRIFGHLNVKDLKMMPAAVNGMKVTDNQFEECITCILGKTINKCNKNPRKRSTKPLQLVHCDLTGPLHPQAKGGFKYGINFVDDFSGMVWIYLLKAKSEAHEALKRFIADVSPQGNLRSIRCDNGTEFTCKTFR